MGAAAFDVGVGCAFVARKGAARISRNRNWRVRVGEDVAFGDVISVTGVIVLVLGVELVGAFDVVVTVVVAVAVGALSGSVNG
jgi:hypothetical protein